MGGDNSEGIGIDIGGSGVRIGRVDLNTGALLAPPLRLEHSTDTPAATILEGMTAALASFGADLPIGLGFPGVVRGSVVETAPNLGSTWPGTDLAVALNRPGLVLLNDADAAAVAEHQCGASLGASGTVMTITVGTGIGTALHRDGVLVPNLELGLLAHPSRGGVIEAHASGRARRQEGLSLEVWAERFQEALHLYEGWLNPDLIVVGGGITERWEEWAPRITTKADLRRAQHGPDAGLVGAALAARPVDGVHR